MNPLPFYAFTLKSSNGVFREIITDVGVSVPFITPKHTESDKIYRTQSLWDTGATNSAITKETADAIGLLPSGKTDVHHATGITTVNVYLINIYLPNNIVIPNVRVSECANTAGIFGIILGMDIITIGDFSITNVNSLSTFSFRIPSMKTIDYVEEHNISQIPSKAIGKVGRNEPCQCGSGKKYKNCHGQ